MKNLIGVMQGRLLPKYQGRYQAHPLGYWQDEFIIANQIGLNCIEFILDFNDAEKNPLLYKGGPDEIIACCEKNNITVKTICADYFMEAPLHSEDEETSAKSLNVLRSLLDVSEKLRITDIVIPCVDRSSLNNQDDVARFVRQINKILDDIETKNINLSLETDLAPQPFQDLLKKFDSKHVTVNYDIGNSASLGYDPVEELDAYGDRITDIHVKDRVLNGGPVILGEGDADFKRFFDKLKEFNYTGPYILQAYRDDEGVEVFQKQLDWVKAYLN